MPKLGPVSRSNLVRYLRQAGFEGPYVGGRHEFMRRSTDRLKIILPNPHQGDISVGLLSRILKQAGISRGDWERL